MSVCVRPSKKGGWEVDILVRLPDGTRLRERRKAPASSKTAALRWGEQRQNHLAIHGRRANTVVPTLEAFAPTYLEDYARANQQKPSTLVHKQQVIDFYLLPRFGKKALDGISDLDVQRLKASMADRRPSTVNNVLSVLNTILKAAVRWRVLERLPCTIEQVPIDVIHEPAHYEPDEYERLVRAAAALDGRILLVVLLGGDAGLRCGEILALEWADVDFSRGALTVKRAEWEGLLSTPKGRRSRQVPMTKRLAAALHAGRHLRGPRVLWRDDGREKVTQVLLAKWIRRAERQARLPETGRLHILRHTFCSRLAAAGAPTKAIQELAGHSHIGTTQRYMHLSPSARSGAIALLDADGGAEQPAGLPGSSDE